MKNFYFALPTIITVLLFFSCLNLPIFAKGVAETESSAEKNDVSETTQLEAAQSQIHSIVEDVIVQDTVTVSELRTRSDIILQAYASAYPDIIKAVIETDDDWALQFHDGAIYYWANGRLLPPEKKDQWEEYRSYQVYPYEGIARNPDLYTPERIEQLRERTSTEVRGAPQLPQDESFLNHLFGSATRGSTETHIVKTILFDKQVSVHEALVAKLNLVDAEVKTLAQSDEEVADFLETLSEVSGYNWRTVAGTNRRSNHSYGLALDVLPNGWGNKAMYWGWIRDFNDDWMLLPQEDLWAPPEKVIEIFKNHGFIWGGTWDIYDTMHFEYRPELIELSKQIIFE